MARRQVQGCPLTRAEAWLDTRKPPAMPGQQDAIVCPGRGDGPAAPCPCARVGTNSPSCRGRLLERLPRPQHRVSSSPGSTLLCLTHERCRQEICADREGEHGDICNRSFSWSAPERQTSPRPQHSQRPCCLPAAMQTADPCRIAPAAFPRARPKAPLPPQPSTCPQ